MRILLTLLSLLIFPVGTFAEMTPVPTLTPQKVPNTIIRKTKFAPKKIQTSLQNTPSEIYAVTYKGKAIEIFQNTGATVFVQKISFSDGGKLGNFFDFFGYDESSGEPLYVRFSPSQKVKNLPRLPTSFINGQFFDPKKINTPLSFGLKVGDTILTSGADNGTKQKNILSYSEAQGVRIIPYTWEGFRDEKSDFTMVNLAPSQIENTNSEVRYGRTYMCTLGGGSEGWSKTLLVFTLISHTEAEASTILTSWGCQKETTSMLDSGGSSLIGLGNQIHYGFTRKGTPDMRKLPHLIGFYET